MDLGVIRTAIASACTNQDPDTYVRAFNVVYSIMSLAGPSGRPDLIKLIYETYGHILRQRMPLKNVSDLEDVFRQHQQASLDLITYVFPFSDRRWFGEPRKPPTSEDAMNECFLLNILLDTSTLKLIGDGLTADVPIVSWLVDNAMFKHRDWNQQLSTAIAPHLGVIPDIDAAGAWMYQLARLLDQHHQHKTLNGSELHALAFEQRQRVLVTFHFDRLLQEFSHLVNEMVLSDELVRIARLLDSARAEPERVAASLGGVFKEAGKTDDEKHRAVIVQLQWATVVCERLLPNLNITHKIIDHAAKCIEQLGADNVAVSAAKFIVKAMRKGVVVNSLTGQKIDQILFQPALAVICRAMSAKDLFQRALWHRISSELISAFTSSASELEQMHGLLSEFVPLLNSIFGHQEYLKRMMTDVSLALKPADNRVFIYHSNSWKLRPVESVPTSHRVFESYNEFTKKVHEEFMKNKGDNTRMLTFRNDMSTAHVRVGRAQLILSLVQLVVLAIVSDVERTTDTDDAKRLCIEVEPTKESIAAQTEISVKLVDEAVETLVAHRVIARGTTGLVFSGKCKTSRPLNLSVMRVKTESIDNSKQANVKEREFELQAAIVRALKSTRRVENSSRLFEIVAAGKLSFHLTKETLRKGLDAVIDRGYATVDEEGVLSYVA